jgi:hypothetical protein
MTPSKSSHLNGKNIMKKCNLLLVVILVLVFISINSVEAANPCKRRFARNYDITFRFKIQTNTGVTDNFSCSYATSPFPGGRISSNQYLFLVNRPNCTEFGTLEDYEMTVTKNCNDLTIPLKVPIRLNNTTAGQTIEKIVELSCRGFLNRKREITASCDNDIFIPETNNSITIKGTIMTDRAVGITRALSKP